MLLACDRPADVIITKHIVRDYDKKKHSDQNRADILKNSNDRYSGADCTEEDRKHKCHEQCSDIYSSRRGDLKACEKLKTGLIEKLAEIHELLEDPDHEDLLAKVDNRDFSAYLNISIAPFDDLIGDRDFGKGDAEELFLWMIEDERKVLDDEDYDSVANILSSEDDDYKVLESLLEELASFSPGGNSIYKPFVEDIGRGRKTLMGLAIDIGPFDEGKNNRLLDWFIDYIEDKNTQCKSEPVHEDCLRVYCEIGERIDEDYANDWLNFDSFLTYIDDIIEEGINGSSTGAGSQWGTDDIEESGDLGDWWETGANRGLCGGLN